AAAVPPKATAAAPVNPVPWTATLAPPASGPLCTPRPLTQGAPKVKRSPATGRLLTPFAETVTSTEAPAAPAGLTAVICVAESTVKAGAGVLPKRTAEAPVKFRPRMVTEVPPAARPAAGVMSKSEG